MTAQVHDITSVPADEKVPSKKETAIKAAVTTLVVGAVVAVAYRLKNRSNNETVEVETQTA